MFSTQEGHRSITGKPHCPKDNQEELCTQQSLLNYMKRHECRQHVHKQE